MTLCLVGVVLILMSVDRGEATVVTTKCEYYNHTTCQETGKGCNETEDCNVAEPNKRNHCYVLWQNSSQGVVQIQKKGCFLDNIDCYNKSRCIRQREKLRKDLLFCCCEGDYCNHEFSWEPLSNDTPRLTEGVPTLRSTQGRPVLNTLMYTLVPILAIIFLVVAGYWMYRRQRMAYFNELSTSEPMTIQPPSPTLIAS